MPGKTPNNGGLATQAKAKRRSEAWVLVYHLLGTDRSLMKLKRHLAAIGLSVSMTTLKDYSAKYGWQDRMRELDARQADARQLTHDSTVARMNERQANMGAAMQTVAGRGLAMIADNAGAMTPGDVARLADIGVKLERLALGEATTRSEIEVTVYNTIIQQIAALFINVNAMDSPDDRTRTFADGVDGIIDVALGSA
jgi:hypothetical protein